MWLFFFILQPSLLWWKLIIFARKPKLNNIDFFNSQYLWKGSYQHSATLQILHFCLKLWFYTLDCNIHCTPYQSYTKPNGNENRSYFALNCFFGIKIEVLLFLWYIRILFQIKEKEENGNWDPRSAWSGGHAGLQVHCIASGVKPLLRLI